jgi:hypothetical protein
MLRIIIRSVLSFTILIIAMGLDSYDILPPAIAFVMGQFTMWLLLKG